MACDWSIAHNPAMAQRDAWYCTAEAGARIAYCVEGDGASVGATVILASRIAAKARAEEILVPDTVRGLLSGKQFLFSDRGDFVPRGFDDAVRVYAVRWHE